MLLLLSISWLQAGSNLACLLRDKIASNVQKKRPRRRYPEGSARVDFMSEGWREELIDGEARKIEKINLKDEAKERAEKRKTVREAEERLKEVEKKKKMTEKAAREEMEKLRKREEAARRKERKKEEADLKKKEDVERKKAEAVTKKAEADAKKAEDDAKKAEAKTKKVEAAAARKAGGTRKKGGDSSKNNTKKKASRKPDDFFGCDEDDHVPGAGDCLLNPQVCFKLFLLLLIFPTKDRCVAQRRPRQERDWQELEWMNEAVGVDSLEEMEESLEEGVESLEKTVGREQEQQMEAAVHSQVWKAYTLSPLFINIYSSFLIA